MRRPCLVDGCWQLTDGKTYCTEHQRDRNRREAARRGSPAQRGYGYHYRKARAKVLERDGWTCVYCHGPADTVDHIIPVSQGGPGTEDNLVAACRSCNSRRGKGRR
jgi:5-methylcytosine-specific restriction endonuclease McrA